MDDIERTLGRIEEKIDHVIVCQDRMRKDLFDPGGIEPRLRIVEGDLREIRTKAGIIATAISSIIALAAWFFSQLFGHH